MVVAQAVVVEARGLVIEPARVADGVAEHAGAFGLAKGPVGVEGIVMDRLNSPSIYGPSSGK